MKKQLLALSSAFVLMGTTGCAPVLSGAMNMNMNESMASQKTAKYFGVAEKDVVVSQFEKGALNTTYQAKVGGKLYNCNIYYGDVQCKQPGT